MGFSSKLVAQVLILAIQKVEISLQADLSEAAQLALSGWCNCQAALKGYITFGWPGRGGAPLMSRNGC